LKEVKLAERMVPLVEKELSSEKGLTWMVCLSTSLWVSSSFLWVFKRRESGSQGIEEGNNRRSRMEQEKEKGKISYIPFKTL
jgi:hypothetical protein